MNGYDPLQHAQTRARKAEARARALQDENEQLIQLLVVVLERQFAGTDVDPLEYLKCLDEIAGLCVELGLDPVGVHRLAA